MTLARALRGGVALWVFVGLCGGVSAQAPKPTIDKASSELRRIPTPRKTVLSRKDQLRVMARAATYYENYKLLIKEGNLVGAQDALIKIIRMDPFPRAVRPRRFLAMTYVSLVDTFIRAKKLEEAWKYANQGLKRTVRNGGTQPSLAAGELYQRMGRIKALQGDSKQAMKFNRQASEILERLDR